MPVAQPTIPRRGRRHRRIATFVALLATILAITAGAASFPRPSGEGPMPGPTAPAPAPSPTEPGPASEATPVVPPSDPVRLLIPAIGVDAPIEVYTDAMVAAADGWIDPTTPDVISWWQGGGTPSSDPDNTVYLYGHVSRREAVFNDLHTLAPGTEVTVVTDAGTVVYEVQEVLEPIAKDALPDDARVNAAVPGRLVLIGCHRDPDQGTRPTTHNVVVIAQQRGLGDATG